MHALDSTKDCITFLNNASKVNFNEVYFKFSFLIFCLTKI